MEPGKTVLLSFDTEEFDVPREHGVPYSLEEGMKVSMEGTTLILDILQKYSIKGTFFKSFNEVLMRDTRSLATVSITGSRKRRIPSIPNKSSNAYPDNGLSDIGNPGCSRSRMMSCFRQDSSMILP